ncbi:MAG: 30S ribosomal protein S17, partial [Candidatus Methanoperedens sp.]|nr:30S ribosomal protein S17 [Candidatus Methanoperedens sp.]
MARDIGLDVQPPTKECTDPNCPFHGVLPVRGQVLSGIVVSDKMDKTVVVQRTFEKKIAKY